MKQSSLVMVGVCGVLFAFIGACTHESTARPSQVATSQTERAAPTASGTTDGPTSASADGPTSASASDDPGDRDAADAPPEPCQARCAMTQTVPCGNETKDDCLAACWHFRSQAACLPEIHHLDTCLLEAGAEALECIDGRRQIKPNVCEAAQQLMMTCLLTRGQSH